MSEQNQDQAPEIPEHVNGYRGLRPKDRRFHALGPKDLKHGDDKETLFTVQLQSAVSPDEQFAIQVPVYKSDSSEDMRARVKLALTIIQERKEDYGAAIEELTQKSHDARRAQADAQKAQHQAAKEEKKLAKLQKKGLAAVSSEG